MIYSHVISSLSSVNDGNISSEISIHVNIMASMVKLLCVAPPSLILRHCDKERCAVLCHGRCARPVLMINQIPEVRYLRGHTTLPCSSSLPVSALKFSLVILAILDL